MSKFIARSADTDGEWFGQYLRMNRWRDRVLSISKMPAAMEYNDVVDFTLAYFVWAHSLKEWLIEAGAIQKKIIDRNLRGSAEWDLCRDIANRCRHYDLRRNPTDKEWRIQSWISLEAALDEKGGHDIWFITHNGQKETLSECVQRVDAMWGCVITELGIEMPNT